jgi:DNA-binding response OmpR family regulator
MTRRILVIDDSRHATKFIALAAGSLGYCSRQCNDSTQALDAFVEFQPDVVVLDMCMPEKDGLEVLEELLLIATSARIIVTTGQTPGYLRVAEGMAEFHEHRNIATLPKPFTRESLLKELSHTE